jgi:hypothetical protein
MIYISPDYKSIFVEDNSNEGKSPPAGFEVTNEPLFLSYDKFDEASGCWITSATDKQIQIILLKRQLDEIDVLSGMPRTVRGAAADMGEMLVHFRKVAMNFADMAEQLQVPGFDPAENVDLQTLIQMDPTENFDLTKIKAWEQKANDLRQQLQELQESS